MQLQPLPKIITDDLIKQALKEDLGLGGDITSHAAIDPETRTTYQMAARQTGVLSGVQMAADCFKTVDRDLNIKILKRDGEHIERGDVLLVVEGCAVSILTAERVALNFMGRMCGIATLTAQMVAAVKPHSPLIAATRKTTPLLRAVEKYAVRCGDGSTHRMRLDDAVMIKDNHIAANGGDIEKTLRRVRDYVGHTIKIEIEVDNLKQFEEIPSIGIADIIMLDNMSCEDMKRAVEMNRGRFILEASGNVNKDTIQEIAATGVDVISIGALTHSAPNFDVGLDVAPQRTGVKTASIL